MACYCRYMANREAQRASLLLLYTPVIGPEGACYCGYIDVLRGPLGPLSACISLLYEVFVAVLWLEVSSMSG